MPEQQINTSQQTGANFIGLQSYTEAESNSFFGRDKEIDQLTKMVDANTLSIVFGRSGTGKTSLLNAGVFPRLRKNNCLPFRIRLEFDANSPDLITQVKNVMRTEIDKYGFKVKNYPTSETLWEYFHKEDLWYLVTPILIFDQFEELFTLAKSSRFKDNELDSFWEELADLIENYIPKKLNEFFLNHKDEVNYDYTSPKAKVIFAFREEYLPEFEDIAKKIPSIKISRFRLLPMSGRQAYDVVTKTWGNNINPAQAEKIVHYFTNEPGALIDDIQGIEPSLLSQVCTFLEKERKSEGMSISAELLNKYPKERILRIIYQNAISESNAALTVVDPLHPNLHPPMMMDDFVERNLITEEGYRQNYKLSQKDNLMWPGINVMTGKYMIRQDDNNLELTHDVLTPLISEDREKQRKKAADSLAKKKAWKIGGIILGFFGIMAVLATCHTCKQMNLAANARDSADKAEIMKKTADSLATIFREHADRDHDSSLKFIQEIDSDIIVKKHLDSLLRVYPYCDTCPFVHPVRPTIDSTIIAKLKDEIKDLNNKISDLHSSSGKLQAQLITLQNEYNNLRNRYTKEIDKADSSQRMWLRNFDALTKKYEERLASKWPPVALTDTITPGAGSFILDFVYKGTYKDFDKLNIYLIPDDQSHHKLIKENKEMDIACDPGRMDRMPGVYKAIYSNKVQQYFFNAVKDGQYLLKVCTLYGTYKTMFIKQGLNGSKRIWLIPPFK